jgi:hypothetical protein
MKAAGRFRPAGPDQLQAIEGGGCASLFGFPFFAAGIFLILIGARVVPLSNASAVPSWAWPLLVGMGLVFMAVGGHLLFGRSWITLDAKRRTVRRQRGLLRPMRDETHGLQGYDAVLLRFEAGDSDTADRFPVLLRATAGGTDLALVGSTEYGESRGQAAAVASFLGLPLIDATTDHEAVSPAHRVDATLQERLRAGDERTEEPIRPLRMQSEVRETGRGVEIVLLGPGFRRGALGGLILGIAAFLYAAPDVLEFLRRSRTPEGVQVVIVAVAALLLIVLPLVSAINAAALARRGRTLVTGSPEGIVIEERAAWRTRTTRLPAADILGLDYGTAEAAFRAARRGAEGQVARSGRRPPAPAGPGREGPAWMGRLRRLATSKGIIVKSRTGFHTVGSGLPDDELRYLHALLVRALAGDTPRAW